MGIFAGVPESTGIRADVFCHGCMQAGGARGVLSAILKFL